MYKITRCGFFFTLVLTFALTGCGGSSGDSNGGGNKKPPSNPLPPPSLTISGTASAPGGQVAMFENKSIMQALSEFFIPSASAIITGLEPVQGALVELIEIDNSGNQVGDVLSKTTTTTTGTYNLLLPDGVNLAANLIVRISGTNIELRAQVVEQTVDISPTSEFVLRNFIENGSDLSTLPINMVATLKGHVEEFDLAAASDMSAMISALESEIGQFVDDSVSAISTDPGLASDISGDIHHGDVNLGFKYMADPMVSWTDISQTISASTGLAAILDDGGNNIGIGNIGGETHAYSQLQTQDLANYWIWYEFSTYAGNSTQLHSIGTVDTNNNFSLIWPFREDFWNDLSYGKRTPPRLETIYSTAIAGTFIETYTDQGIIYRLTDTDSDGTNDALDPDAPVGHESQLAFAIIAKPATDFTLAKLAGDYGSVYMAEGYNGPGGNSGLIAGAVDSTIDGVGRLTETAEDAIQIQRTPNGDGSVSLAESSVTGPAALNSGTFSLPSSNGEFTYVEDGSSTSFFGFASSNGELAFEALTDNTEIPDGTGGTKINSTTLGFAIAVKKPITTPILSSRTFRFMGIEKYLSSNGELSIERVRGDDDRLVFNADGSQITVQLNGLDVLSRPGDTDDFKEESLPDTGNVTLAVTVGSDGAISFTENNAVNSYTREWKGFVSESGNLIILNVIHRDNDGNRFGEGVYIASALN